MKPQDYAIFYAGAKGELRSHKFPVSEGELPDEVLVAVTDFETVCGKALDTYESAAEAIVAFRAHLDQYQPPTMYEIVTAELAINTQFGSLSIVIKPVAGNLQGAINAAFRDLESLGIDAKPTKPQNGNGAQSQTPPSAPGTEEWSVVGLSKKVDPKSNEVRYRVHGGRWQDFGVAIYPEQLKMYPFITEVLAMAEPGKVIAPRQPIIATVSLKPDGKPKKLESMKW